MLSLPHILLAKLAARDKNKRSIACFGLLSLAGLNPAD
jgi:hypothetical protein